MTEMHNVHAKRFTVDSGCSYNTWILETYNK